MDQQTQQLAHKVGIFLATGMVAMAFIFMLAVAWQQGDGQAREMVSLLQPTVLGALGGLLGLLGINTVVNGVVAVKTAGTVQQIPAANVAVPVAVPVPAPVSVPVPVASPVSVPVTPAALTPAQIIQGTGAGVGA